MSGVRKQVDQIISGHIAPFLKEQGFKKTARNWYRQNPESIFAINLQTSSWNPSRFTLNLGVHIPRIYALFTDKPQPEKPQYYQCGTRERIGDLMPVRSDYWWEIDFGKSLERIGTEIVFALRDYGLPWMEAHLTPESAAEYLKDKESIYSAAASLASGDREDAARRLKESIEQMKQFGERYPAMSAFHFEWGKKHGLIED